MTDQIDIPQKVAEQSWGDLIHHLLDRIKALEAKIAGEVSGTGYAASGVAAPSGSVTFPPNPSWTTADPVIPAVAIPGAVTAPKTEADASPQES